MLETRRLIVIPTADNFFPGASKEDGLVRDVSSDFLCLWRREHVLFLCRGQPYMLELCNVGALDINERGICFDNTVRYKIAHLFTTRQHTGL